MFKSLFKKKLDIISSPVDGQIVPLADVPDPVFSQKMMGEGIAVKPKSGIVAAPVAGEIVQLSDTKHAFGIRTENGAEILVHVGLETVALNGEGFELCADQGDHVQKGQPILKVDLGFIREQAASDLVILVVTNSSNGDFHLQLQEASEAAMGETELIRISRK